MDPSGVPSRPIGWERNCTKATVNTSACPMTAPSRTTVSGALSAVGMHMHRQSHRRKKHPRSELSKETITRLTGKKQNNNKKHIFCARNQTEFALCSFCTGTYNTNAMIGINVKTRALKTESCTNSYGALKNLEKTYTKTENENENRNKTSTSTSMNGTIRFGATKPNFSPLSRAAPRQHQPHSKPQPKPPQPATKTPTFSSDTWACSPLPPASWQRPQSG